MTDAARLNPSGAPFLFRGAFLAAMLLAAIYTALQATGPAGWVVVAVKAAFCPLLAVSLWAVRGGDGNARRLCLALLLSAAGDVFLALDPVRLFVFGLASFLLAHLVYLWQFVLHRPRPFALPVRRRLIAVAILVAVAAMLAVLMPHLGSLLIPVCAYIAAITAMALSAVAVPGRTPLMIGALFFMLSDSLIALNKFVMALPYASLTVWGTYALAQMLIVLGWRRGT